MLIMALDLATTTGVAYGPVGGMPKIERVRLKRPSDPQETAGANIAAYLRDRWVLDQPEMVMIEHFMDPAGHKSSDAAILAIGVHFVVTAMCASRLIAWRTVYPATWRTHFMGQASAGTRRPKGSPPRTPSEQRAQRDATKAMTLQRAKVLGYLPADCQDADKGDAAGIWDYAAHTFGRRTPAALHLYGEQSLN